MKFDGNTALAEVLVELTCEMCGGPVANSGIEAEAKIEHQCKPKSERGKKWKRDAGYKKGEPQYKIESDGEAQGTEWMGVAKDDNGIPLKPRRRIKFYGFTVQPEIMCRECGEVFSITLKGEEAASEFYGC